MGLKYALFTHLVQIQLESKGTPDAQQSHAYRLYVLRSRSREVRALGRIRSKRRHHILQLFHLPFLHRLFTSHHPALIQLIHRQIGFAIC